MAATEIDIPDILSSKKGERESEILEEKVREFSVNKVKQVEVAESVNTQVETESETFFQALSVPTVSADEGTPESCKAATTEDQEERKTTKSEEAFTEEKPFDDQSVQIVVSKEETEEDKSINSQEDQREQKTKESVTKSVESCSEIKQEEDTEEIKPGVEGGLQEKTHHSEGNEPEAVKTKEDIEDDVEETTFQHATTVAYFEEEQILNAASKDIPKEEEVEDRRIDPQEASEKCENGAKDEREQEAEESADKFVHSSLEIEKKEDDEVIKPSVETEEKTELTTDDCITSQTESHVVSAEHEIKNDGAIQSEETGSASQKVEYKEEVKHSDSSLTEIKSESPMVKEVSEESVSEKAIYEEGLKLPESSNIAMKENEIASKVEDEEKEQDDKSSDAQEASEHYENEGKDKIEQYTSSSVETKESKEKVNEEALWNDDGQTKKFENPLVKEVCEPEEVQKEFESFSMPSNNEIVSKEENQEKEQELKMSKEVQRGEVDVTSSQNASSEDKKETITGQQETPVANIEFEEQHQSAITKEIIREAVEDKASDAQEASEECVNGAKDEREQKSEENVNKNVHEETSSEKVEYEEEVKHSDSSNVEINEKKLAILSKDEDQGEDIVTSSQNTTYEGGVQEKEHHSEGNELEVVRSKENIEEDIEKNRTSEESVLENSEFEEGLQLSDISNIARNENEIARKVEYEEKEHEVYVSEKGQGGGDDVTSSQYATCEDIKETTVGQRSSMPKEIFNEEGEDKSSDTQENEAKYKTEQNASSSNVETKENEEKLDEEDIVEDDGQSKKFESPLVKEVCEATSLQNDESELNENEIVSKEGNEENELELKMSEEVQGGEDDVISSQNATTMVYYEEKEDKTIDAQEASEKCDDGTEDKSEQKPEEIVNKIVESSSKIEQDEDTEETKPSVEKEQQVCEEASSEKIQYKEEVKYSESSNTETMVKEVCEEIQSEEGLKLSDNSNIALHENEIASKVEDEEKEQEVYILEKGQSGGDDVKSSQDATCEDIKETTVGEHVTTVAYLKEGQVLSSTHKENLKEEAEDKSSDAQEASEQYKSGANEKIEQKPEESINTIENTEEIKPSVETEEKKQEKITSNEIEEDVKVCEETQSEKVKFEGVELSDKDEDQEKEQAQESIISEEDQGKDDVTCSQDATSIEDLPEFVKPRESIEEDIEEIKSSAETKDDIKIDKEAIVNDDDQTKKSEIPLVKEVCEATSLEKVESEIVSKEENQEKKQELKMLEEVQGGGDDVISLQNASSEDIKETKIGQDATTMTYFEEKQNHSAIDAQEDKKGQKSEEDSEEIKPSVETDQQTDDCITSQTECQVESEEHEVKSKEPIESDDGQKENVDSSPVNEVCEETSSEKVGYSEEVKETTNEKEITLSLMPKEILKEEAGEKSSDAQEVVCISAQTESQEETTETEEKNEESIKEVYEETSLEKVEFQEGVKTIETFKDEDQEEDQVDMSAGQGEDNVTSSQVATSEEDLQKKNYQEGKEPGFIKTRESIEENIEEIESSIKTKENEENEEKIEEEAIVNDDGQTDKSKSPLVKEVCEVTGSEKAESELNENEIVSKEENEEKEHELKISSEDAMFEDIKESTIQHVSKVVDFEESKHESALTKEILKEEAEEKSIDAQEASEQYDQNEAKDKIEENPEESANIILHSYSEIEQEEYTEEIKPSIKTDEKEQQEVCEETDLKKTVSEEGIKLSDSSYMYPNEKQIAILSKDEYQEKEQELNIPEKDQGEDEVICSQDAVAAYEEDLQVNEHKSVETREIMKEDIEVIRTNVETEEKVEQEGLPDAITTDVFTSAQMESQEESTEPETPLIHSVKEVCDETSLEKVEYEEGVKAIETFKDGDQEKDQVNKSAEGKGEDHVTTSQVATLEEDLLKKNYQEEDKEPEFVEMGESIEEDTKEIKSSVETIEKTEAIIVNDDDQTEKSKSSLVNEVCEVTELKKAESELNEDETVSIEENQENEKDLKILEEVQRGGDDVITSKNASSEDIKEASIGQHATTVAYFEEGKEQTEIIKEIFLEDLETVSEVTESKEISSEEKTEQTTEIGENDSLYMKEDITQEDQPNSTEDCNEISKDAILTKEIEQVPLETQKEKETNDIKEHIVEEDSHSTEFQEKSTEDQKAHVISYSDPSESEESPKQALEFVCDVQTPKVVVDSEDSKVKEESIVSATTEFTDENNGEEEHEVRANENSSAENLEIHGELKPTSELVVEEDQVKETKPQPEQSDVTSENIMENVILTEKDLADGKTTTSNEKELANEVLSELGQPKGQNVEEIQAGQTETISEIIEEEIPKKDENLSHESIEDLNDITTKEEEIFQDERTRELEPVEEHNDTLDESSKEKSTDLNETTEVEPQERSIDTPKILPVDHESVYDSNLKEDYLTSATTTYVHEEKETVTKEISSDEMQKTEQTTEIGEDDSLYEKEDPTQKNQVNSTEDYSEMSKDVILTEEVSLNIQKEKETDDLKEQIFEEDNHSTKHQEKSTKDQKEMAHVISYSDPTPVGVSEVRTDEVATEETTESKQVAKHLSVSSRDAVLIKENLEVHEELKSTSESVIEEDHVKETKPEPEFQSDITSENIINHTSEKDLADEKGDMEVDVTLAAENQIDNTENQNETIKNVILTDEVAVETEKEEEKNEVKEHISEEDICPRELDKTSTSYQKELADEIEYSRPIPAGNNEVKEESPNELENIQVAEAPNIEFENKEKDDELISEIQTPETTLNVEMKEKHLEATNDTCQTLVDGSLSEKKLVSPEGLASSTIEDQTNKLVLETDNTKVDHISISNKDQNLEFTEEKFPKILEKEEKTFEEDANKEKETIDESQADDPTKTTSDSISSSTEQGIEVTSVESRGYADIHKLEEKSTEVFEIASEVPEIAPEGRKVSEILSGNIQEASPMMLLEKNDPETTTTIEKITPEVAIIDVEKREKAFDYATEAKLEPINKENQSEHKKDVYENIEREIPTEKEPLELDAHVTPATEELEISQKNVTYDLIKISKIQPEIQTYESIERKLLTGTKDVSNEQEEPTTKSLIVEADDLKATKASSTEPQCSSEAFREEKKMDDEKEKSQTTVAENLIEEGEIDFKKDQKVDKEETGEKGAKTDEENEEEDDEDNQINDAPVMVEASKDIEVKAHKKSHNILSGVGSKVKHSIAKVKKAITGKSSHPKPSSPKEKDQVIT